MTQIYKLEMKLLRAVLLNTLLSTPSTTRYYSTTYNNMLIVNLKLTTRRKHFRRHKAADTSSH